MFEHLAKVKVYEPGKPIEEVVAQFGIPADRVIKLASNENPYGPPPKVAETIRKWADRVNRYPDDSYRELKKGLSRKFGVPVESILIGAGSDQLLEFAVRGVRPKRVLTAGITFAMYQIFAEMEGAEVIKTPSPTHDLSQFYDLYLKYRPELIFICTPNNPLGEAVDREELLQFIEKIGEDTLIVVDGAYQEFAQFKDPSKGVDPAQLLDFKNVLYTGTFSKAYGLGGMRLGYGIGNRWLIENLSKLRPPFNITTLTLQAGIAALEEEEWVRDKIAKNFSEMERYEKFARRWELKFIESYTNFILLFVPDATHLTHYLLRRGVIVRNMAGYGIEAVRITIGTPEENGAALHHLEEYFRKEGEVRGS
jgi:histidinol-phosphate aminotransferase